MSKHHNPFDGLFDDSPGYDGDEPEGADFQVEKTLQESDKALQVVLLDTGDIKWIPKSVIHSESEVYQVPTDGTDGAGTLIIYQWFAEQQGWL